MSMANLLTNFIDFQSNGFQITTQNNDVTMKSRRVMLMVQTIIPVSAIQNVTDANGTKLQHIKTK